MKMRFENMPVTLGADTQRGMALVFALVVLLILTILGVSALRTSSLEQLMAGNTQEQTRAFEAADSGLSHALNVTSAMADPTGYTQTTYPYQTTQANGTDKSTASATAYPPTFLQTAPMPRSSTPSGSSVCAAYYDQSVTGTSGGAALAQDIQHQRLQRGAPCPPPAP